MHLIEQRLAALRTKMREAGYAGYYIPTDDFHLSEYVGAHFKARAYMSCCKSPARRAYRPSSIT